MKLQQKVPHDTFRDGGSKNVLDGRLRSLFYVSAALVLAYLIFLIVRPTGAYSTPIDGWLLDAFELSMGALCILRYFHRSWRSDHSAVNIFPLILGLACLSWALGDVSSTFESFGGQTPPVPSVADGFFVGFFPLCYASFMLVIRRGNNGSLIATSLDGLVAGLGVASLSAAYIFSAVLKTTGGGVLSTATTMSYPIGDVLLLALAIGALAVLPKRYRLFFGIAAISMAVNGIGDLFNLLQPNGRAGYVANAVMWPISLLMLAIATWVQPAITEKVSAKASNAEEVSTERTAGFVIPALGALAGIVVLFTASIGHIGKPAVALATGTLLVAGVRLTLTVREARALNSA